MTNDRQLERLLDAWFTEGPTMAPDRVIDDVAARITRQPQLPEWRLRSWRFPTVSTPLKLVLIGAALVAALVAGSIFIGAGGRSAVPAPTPTPTPTPTAVATPATLPSIPDGSMQAGTYIGHPIPGSPLTWTVTVPAGWTGGSDEWVLYGRSDPELVIGGPADNESVPVDSCAPAGTVPAQSVDEFVAAVQARDDWTVSTPVDVTLRGYSGQQIDVELPADVTCENGNMYTILASPSGDGWFRVSPSSTYRLWILDIEGVPMVLFRSHGAATSADLVRQADDVVDSIVLTP